MLRSLLDDAQAETLCEFRVLSQEFALQRVALLRAHPRIWVPALSPALHDLFAGVPGLPPGPLPARAWPRSARFSS
jgi:hypothetical protein